MESGTSAKLLLLLLWVLCLRHQWADGQNPYGNYINVDNGDSRGTWALPVMCPKGLVATGFSLKVRAYT